VTSRQETTPDRIAAAVSTADHCQIGASGGCALAGFRNTAFLAGFAAPPTPVLFDFFATLFFEGLVRLTAFLAKSVIPHCCSAEVMGAGTACRAGRYPQAILGKPYGRAAQIELSLRFLSCVPGGKIAIWQNNRRRRTDDQRKLN
jgi:hypothetical protein